MPTVTNPVAVSLTVPTQFTDGSAIPAGFITHLQYGFGTIPGTYTVIVDDPIVAIKKAFTPALSLAPGTWYGAARLVTQDGPGEWGNESSFQVIARIPKVIMQITAVRTLTQALAAPALSSSVAGSTATLTWVPPTPTGQSAIAGYRVYKSSTLSGTYTQVGAALPANQLSLTDSLPATSFYKVEAFDQFVTGGRSAGVQCDPITGTRYKWHPGHYGSSDGRFSYSSTPSGGYLADITTTMNNQPWIVGHRQFVTWAAVDVGPLSFTGSVGGATSGTLTGAPPRGNDTYWFRFSNGNTRNVVVTGTACTWSGALSSGSVTTADVYRFSQMDILLGSVAQYGGVWGPSLLGMTFSGGYRNSDISTIPQYILNNSTYGPCPTATGQSGFGWWGGEYSDGTGAYTAAIYRPAVANRYGLLGQAFGAYYDGNPNYELLCDQENSAVTGPAVARQTFGTYTGSTNVNDPSYSDTQYLASMKTYLQMWRDYHPHTSIVVQNTFMQGATATQQLATWMIANGYDVGGADTIGQSYYDAHPTAAPGVNYGISAYAGFKDAGNTSSETYPDMRGKAACSMDVEGPDIGTGSSAVKTPHTPLDLCIALNQTYKASRAFWSVIPEGSHGAMTWANDMTQVLRNNPLTQISYPLNYPQ